MAAKDISLVGATFYAVPQVDLPISGGGTASFVEISDTTATAADVASGKYFYTAAGVKTEGTASGGGGGSWSWKGENATLVKDYALGKTYLADSAYATWTPSTTQETLVSAQPLTAFTTVDFAQYDYVVEWEFHTHFEYGSGSTGKAIIYDFYNNQARVCYGTASNLSAVINNTISYYSNGSYGTTSGIYGVNSTGVTVFTTSPYGVYSTGGVATSPSASGISITIPVIYARCNAIYFSTTNAAAVDQSASYYEQICKIWRVDRGTDAFTIPYKTLYDHIKAIAG